MTTEVKPKSNKKKAILIGLGVVATAVGGFFGFKYLKNRNNNSDTEEEETTTPVTTTSSTQTSSSSSWTKPSSTTTTRKDEFPLKKGSKGERVKAMQQQLIAKYGKTILPRYGADGDFGSEMVAALEKKGLPAEVTESAYNLFVKGAAPDSTTLAKDLYNAAESNSYSSALSNLKKLRNTDDYSEVSTKFKEYRIDGGVRKTLVTGMLDTFKTTSQQDVIRMEFLRMGLKYDGSKWSIPSSVSFFSGVNDSLLITTEPTELIDLKHKVKVKVPAKMVIGRHIKSKNGLTLFRTLEKNKKLIVKTSTIKNHA
ncbi:MAG: hypothetical protein IT233_00660 [Bacteroidia bacterium]|nr:hypothetical protein [Bacteroidia bacterium]